MAFLEYLHRAVAGPLTENEAESAMLEILDGEATGVEIAAFLVALRVRGETAEEVTGLARAMRARVCWVDAGLPPSSLVDTCGTGGDGRSTFNISTVAALVVAGAGVRVAKHGNRSMTSHCGSADLMEALGVRIDLAPERMARALKEVGLAFLFAPALHPAMKHAQPARAELKMRTVFNLLGPLTNPAGAAAQLIGAPNPAAARLMAEALSRLGTEHSLVVHGLDGLDEITTTGPSLMWEVGSGEIRERQVTPADFRVRPARLEEIQAHTLEENVEAARAVLAGRRGAARDIVLVNAAAALVAAGAAAQFSSGMALAAHAIDSGGARRKLEALVEFSQPV